MIDMGGPRAPRGSATPWAGGPGCTRKQAEQASKNASPWPLLSSCLGFPSWTINVSLINPFHPSFVVVVVVVVVVVCHSVFLS